MKLKIRLNNAKKQQVSKELIDRGIEISEDTDLILTEDDYHGGQIYWKAGTDTVILPLSDILYIESLGKNIYVHTHHKILTTNTRIYILEQNLPNDQFIRISHSTIIKKNAIKKIRPTLSQKFYLTLNNGDTVDVTRTYYYKFKDYYGI